MEHRFFKIYKPYGMLSQLSSNDPKEQKKRFLMELNDFPAGIMPVGRLDQNSEGLLLLTTDGSLSDKINRSGVEKEYYAQLDGLVTDTAIENLQQGIRIGLHGTQYTTQKCVVEKLEEGPTDIPPADPKIRIARHRPCSWIRIVLTEGKFRQIRKMTAAVGFPTLRLIRVRVGLIELTGMNPGDVIELDIIP